MLNRVLPCFLGSDRHDNGFLSSDLRGDIRGEVRPHETTDREALDSLEDGVGVQVDAHHIRGRVVQVEVAGVDANDEGHRRQQHVGHLQRAQRDVGTEPAQREAHLETHTITLKQRWLHRSQSILIRAPTSCAGGTLKSHPSQLSIMTVRNQNESANIEGAGLMRHTTGALASRSVYG